MSTFSFLLVFQIFSFQFNLLIADYIVDVEFYILFGRPGQVDFTHLTNFTHKLTSFFR